MPTFVCRAHLLSCWPCKLITAGLSSYIDDGIPVGDISWCIQYKHTRPHVWLQYEGVSFIESDVILPPGLAASIRGQVACINCIWWKATTRVSQSDMQTAVRAKQPYLVLLMAVMHVRCFLLPSWKSHTYGTYVQRLPTSRPLYLLPPMHLYDELGCLCTGLFYFSIVMQEV